MTQALDTLTPRRLRRATAPAGVAAPGDRPAHDTVALSRTRGGTFSPTVSTIRFTDGTSAHTDLIRLNPDIDTYSLDFHGRSPQQLAHYRDVEWSSHDRPGQHRIARDIAWILTNSFPHVPLRRLGAVLQAAGRPGAAGLKEHEAIAATQAAIWRVTNGLELDTRRIDVPVHLGSSSTGGPSVAHSGDTGVDWTASWGTGGEAVLELGLADAAQLRAVDLVARSVATATTLQLERSVDGLSWSPVSSSRIHLAAGAAGAVRKGLGVGATLSSTGPGGAETGHRHYRLVARSDGRHPGRIDLHGIALEIASPSRFRNDDRVVHLYEHLGRPADDVVVDIRTATTRVRRLAGSRVPGGNEEFTPLVTLTTRPRTSVIRTAPRHGARRSDPLTPTRPASVPSPR